MSSVPQGNRFAPPTAHVEDVQVSGEFELARRGVRLLAAIVDGFAVAGLFWAVSATLFRGQFELLRTGAMSVFTWLAVTVALTYACYLAINGYLLHASGQTLGKRLFNVRIVQRDGTKASFVRLAVVRYAFSNLVGALPLLGQLFILADLLCIFRESRQCLHDNIADTMVVKVAQAR